MCLDKGNRRHDPEFGPQIVLEGYALGVFPMADDSTGRIMWFSPDPRAIIDLDLFHIPRSVKAAIRRNAFRITVDRCFGRVIRGCADRRPTWISPQIIDVYCELHRTGFAHSLETWQGDELVGGLYGVALGAAFFGESMFHRVPHASNVALVALVRQLRDRRFQLLDIQYQTPHLERFGALLIPRRNYLRRLQRALAEPRKFLGPKQTEIILTHV